MERVELATSMLPVMQATILTVIASANPQGNVCLSTTTTVPPHPQSTRLISIQWSCIAQYPTELQSAGMNAAQQTSRLIWQ